MAPGRLSFDERKQVLKWYWKFENIAEVQREWKRHYGTSPPTRITIARLREKFDNDGTVQDVCQKYSGRPPTGGAPNNLAASAISCTNSTAEKSPSVPILDKIIYTMPNKSTTSSGQKQTSPSNEKQSYVSSEKAAYESSEKTAYIVNEKQSYTIPEKPTYITTDKPAYTTSEKSFIHNDKLVYTLNNKVPYNSITNEKPTHFSADKSSYFTNDTLSQHYRPLVTPQYKPISNPQYKQQQQFAYDTAMARENLVQQILKASK